MNLIPSSVQVFWELALCNKEECQSLCFSAPPGFRRKDLRVGGRRKQETGDEFGHEFPKLVLSGFGGNLQLIPALMWCFWGSSDISQFHIHFAYSSLKSSNTSLICPPITFFSVFVPGGPSHSWNHLISNCSLKTPYQPFSAGIPIRTQWAQYYFYSHFLDEEAEVAEVQVACPTSHR